MENIHLHIEYLLLRHDCVIVPGIGAFVALSRPGSFNPADGLILPPARIITFNPSISHDDGMLVNSIARRRQIKYGEARAMLSRAVDALRRRIAQGATVRIGNIGSLAAGPEENLVFTPRLREEALLSEQGLLPVAYKRIAVKESGIKQPAPMQENSAAPARTFSDKYYYIPVHKTAAHIAASLIVILAVALSLIVPGIDNNGHRQAEASVFPVERIILQASKANAARLTVDKTATDAAVETENASQAEEIGLPKAAETDTLPSQKFHLIVATFHSAADAAEYIVRYDSEGSEELHAIQSGHTWRVSRNRSGDRGELVRMLSTEQITSKYPGAWVWEEKN